MYVTFSGHEKMHIGSGGEKCEAGGPTVSSSTDGDKIYLSINKIEEVSLI